MDGVTAPQRPPAGLLWPADQNRPLLAKATRVDRIVLELTRRRIPLAALSVAVGRAPRWLSDKLGIGRLDDFHNFSDAILATLERELEDPKATFPQDRRGLHTRHRPRRQSGQFGGYDPGNL